MSVLISAKEEFIRGSATPSGKVVADRDEVDDVNKQVSTDTTWKRPSVKPSSPTPPSGSSQSVAHRQKEKMKSQSRFCLDAASPIGNTSQGPSPSAVSFYKGISNFCCC